jgi:hypothetical protein
MLKRSCVLSIVTAATITVAVATGARANVITGVSIQDVSSQLTQNFNRAAAYTVTAPGLNVDLSVPGSYSTTPDGNMWLNTGIGGNGGFSNTGTMANPNEDTAPQITWNLGGNDFVSTMRIWNYNESGNFSLRGIDTADVYVSSDGTNYTFLESIQLNRAPGTETVDFSQLVPVGTTTHYIRFENITDFPDADSNFVGLSAIEFNTAPEPSSLIAILGLGGMGLLLVARRRVRFGCAPCKLGAGLVCAIACLVGSMTSASAATIREFMSAPNNPDSTRTDSIAQAGFGFSANPSGTQQINELGFWVSPADSGGTGKLAVSHEVGLYDFNGSNYTLIAEGTVAAGSQADSNGYAWVVIPTVTLSDTRQGADYYIVMATEGTDVWAPNAGSAHATVVDPIFGTPTGNGWTATSAFPGVGGTDGLTVNLGNGGYFGPNIGLVPEPSSIVALCGLGLAGLVVAVRRRRKAA